MLTAPNSFSITACSNRVYSPDRTVFVAFLKNPVQRAQRSDSSGEIALRMGSGWGAEDDLGGGGETRNLHAVPARQNVVQQRGFPCSEEAGDDLRPRRRRTRER